MVVQRIMREPWRRPVQQCWRLRPSCARRRG